MGSWTEAWLVAGFAMYLGGAAACAIGAGWIWRMGDRDRPDRRAVLAALSLTASWCVMVAAFGPLSSWSSMAEVCRNLAWLHVLYRLFAHDGRHETLRPIRPVMAALAFVECLQIVLIVIAVRFAITTELEILVFQVSAMFRVMVSVGALVLLHNLYVGATQSIRPVLRWTAAALAAMWSFDLNFDTVAYLGGELPLELAAIRGLVVASMTVPLAIGSTRSAAQIRLRPSRKVAFQTLSLLVIGAYLLLMVGIAQSLSMLGGDVGRLTQVGFTFAATVVALLWLPSHRLRGWVRVTAVKHLFQHRYDYRAEWLRFTQTIGQIDGHSDGLGDLKTQTDTGQNPVVSSETLQGETLKNPTLPGQTLQERIVKSMADITDSPSGLLFLVGEGGALELASRWNWKNAAVPATDPIPRDLADLFESRGFILDLDDIRAGKDWHGEAVLLPDWLRCEQAAWAIVPLLHFDRLIGVIVLSRPAEPRRLDWEDFDLLRVVGQQLASYLAEQAGQTSLMESARFDEFNRRIAFVMHDIKNLASQLSLLSRNAQRHADNPEFRADMLVTLKNSADKLNGLLARLNRYGTSGSETRGPIDMLHVVKRVMDQYEAVHPLSLARRESGEIIANAEGLEQALVHLVQNAIDASDAGSPVSLDISSDGASGRIEVIDSGCGMSAEFIRDGLFKPFVSSKNSGFGIGAFEAREMIRGMGGRLDVDSREGIGTRFAISFPLAAAQIGANEPKLQQQMKVV
ncbi:XrtA/PEP-CTERM system histidine kinase PrsK [Pontixanthobacter sp.]|uniref:XrtA/PEP-CTERM system histidine kinase PrsK n=1 Tax=Pontixanthobacter sp. TaxID=2792078 RepID=UPI003C7C24E4